MPVNEYKLPDVGEGLTEAEIVSWHVKVGDTVKVNDVVCEIETAKSVVELPSPYSGTVTAIHAAVGDTVEVGTPIISFGEPGDVPSGDGGPAESAGAPPAAEGDGGDEEPMKTLVGYGPRTGSAKRRPRRGAGTPASDAGSVVQEQVQGAFTSGPVGEAEVDVPAEEPPATTNGLAEPSGTEPSGGVPVGGTAAGAAVTVLAKPPVRKLAKDLGVDLTTVTPSGPNGTITREDVQAASGGAQLREAPAVAARTGAEERERREPIKGVRKMMAQAMVDSAYTAPHVTEWITVDVTKTMKFVERLRARREFADVKVSPLLVVARAVCLAVRRTPEVNATWDDAAQEVVFKNYVNLGIAAATPRGLVVPNIKDADALSMRELAEAIGELTRTARDGKTQPAEMSGGTFTITNVGVFGVDAGTPIINPGESAILCFGAVRKQPWVVTKDGRSRIRPRDITTLALSFDHRLVDGEKGSRFLADVAGILEDPANALMF